MKTVTIRDFRTRPKQVRAALKQAREAVLTANGVPVAVMIAVDAGTVDQTLETLRRARALETLRALDEYKMCCAAPNSGFQPRWSTSFFQRWINSRSTLRLRLRGPSSFPIPMTNHSFRLPQQRRAYS